MKHDWRSLLLASERAMAGLVGSALSHQDSVMKIPDPANVQAFS